MVLNFDDELNFQDYSNSNEYKHHQQQQHDRKQDNTNGVTPLGNHDHHTVDNEIAPRINIEFSAAEWEYLTNHCISLNTYDTSKIEISPSISNQTFQLLRPSFCSEYDTDATDLMGFMEQHNQQNQAMQLQLQLHKSLLLQLTDLQQPPPQPPPPPPPPQLQLQMQLQLQYHQINNQQIENQTQLHNLYQEQHLKLHSPNSHDTTTLTSNNCNINQITKPPDDFCFPSSLDYNTFLENIMEKDNLNCERSFTSNIADVTCSTAIFIPENYEHELYMLQQEIQENNLPLEHYQPPSIENINNEDENEDDFMGPDSDLLTTATTTAVSATTATLLILLILLVKSPSQILVDFDDFVTSPIYEWPSDETCGHVNLMNNIKVRLANLEPKTVSDAVKKTIREEFIIQDLFLNGQSPLPPEIPKSIRKKSDRDVEWTPLSVYKAYTNIKSPANGKEAYNHLVPYTSCIGTLNYRPKDHAAWKRAPNRRR